MEIFSEPEDQRVCCEILCLILMSESATVKSHQNDCLNMSLTRSTIDSSTGKPGRPPSHTNNCRELRNVDSREICYPIPKNICVTYVTIN